EIIPENSLIIFNDTKVIHARILFEKPSGTPIEIFCLEPNEKEIQVTFSSKESCEWKCMVGNLKRWKNEILEKKIITDAGELILKAEKIKVVNDSVNVRFSWIPMKMSFAEILNHFGVLPLPPYLNRENIESDEVRYQTVYAHQNGSVAAPTAGLHFTSTVFEKLKIKNIETEFFTLHVGAGTFKPVKSETMEEHEMHEEQIFVSLELIEKIISKLGKEKIVAVGTTSLRMLESLYWYGVKLLNGVDSDEMIVEQWEPYEVQSLKFKVENSLKAVVEMMVKKNISVLKGSTKILIAPTYEFKVVDVLITNFHQPESTLLLLVAAFAGKKWKDIYDYALKNNFRFLSYGDSSILVR
ncbi:MAG: S-adenosylmethionine:tRNA ribosyltransferase-isomerase, partial [Bacteroidia bacterium]